MEFNFTTTEKGCILALGAESAGNFSVSYRNKLYFSDNFGDLLDEADFRLFKTAIASYLKKNKLTPDIILTDLHPLYQTTTLGAKLAKKFNARHIQIQHHHAHLFSAIGDKIIQNPGFRLRVPGSGIIMDGTGYGTDGKIWGGEIFKFEIRNSKFEIFRIGHLENQILLGGDLASQEPARMLISILSKFLTKDAVFQRVKKFYTRNEFELLFNQLKNNFNCLEASSTGRVLDAVAVLLGFSANEREYKHSPAIELEKNSTRPYTNLKPIIKNNELLTTPLFEYLIKNIAKDKQRLAATAQFYLAQGLLEIIKNIPNTKYKIQNTFIAGGLTNNKIISNYLESKGADANKKTCPEQSRRVPRGDAGISFGQIIYFLTTE